MEIHTPSNDMNAGHVPTYLDGIINTIFLDELSINPEERIPHYGVSISYLDYVIDVSRELWNRNGIFEGSRFAEDAIPDKYDPFIGMDVPVAGTYQALSLKIFTKALAKQEHKIVCDPSENPSIEIQKHLSNKVLDRILFLSNKNKEEQEEHFPTGFDIQLTGDKHSDKRKIVSRILNAANLIMSKGRRGPATFIMIGKDYIDYLRQDVQDDVAFQSMAEIGNFAYGLNVLVSGKLGNTIIVGRCPKVADEPGIHLVTTHQDIAGDINFKNGDISDVDVVYMLAETGSAPELNYLQFNILDHVD